MGDFEDTRIPAMIGLAVALFISFAMLLPLTQVIDAAVPAGGDGSSTTYTSTADFDGGTKAHPYTDGVQGAETVTDNPHVTANTLTLGRIAGDTFAQADTDSETWRWRPQFSNTEGCTNLGTLVTSISGGELHMSITRSAGVSGWGGIRTAYALSGDLDIQLFLEDVSTTDQDEIWDFVFSDLPATCGHINNDLPTASGVFYRVQRTCVDATCLRLQAFTFSGPATQVGTNTDISSLSMCLRVARSGTTWTWYYDSSGACTSWTTDETTTFSVGSVFVVPVVSDQVGASDAAAFDIDNYAVTVGTPIAVGSRVSGTDSAYEGISDYDSQIFTNARGEMLYVTGRGSGFSDDRIHVRYSLTGGQSWSPRIILFSADAQGDGIIDADLGGMWEFSGVVVSDVLYLTTHLNPPGPGAGGTSQNAFTKVDISNVRNVETYSNWRSADGDPPPSQGGGSDGAGYDLISPTTYIDPSIEVFAANDIWVAMIRSSVVQDAVYVTRWNGASWSSPTVIYDDAGNLDVTLVRLRRLSDGDLVVAFTKTQADAFNPAIVSRCNKSGALDCTSSANWAGMDGAGSFDYVIDTGAGAFHQPILYEDASNRVHVLAVSAYAISAFFRLFHNYYSGGVWVNAETENAAGTRVDVTINLVSEPRVTNADAAMFFDVDASGRVVVLLAAANGPEGAGLYSFLWDGSWTAANYVFRSFGGGRIVGPGYMRGHEVLAPFLVSSGITQMQIVFASGGVAGDPWWDDAGTTSTHAFRMTGTWTSPTTTFANQRVASITLGHSSLSATAYIDLVEILDDSAVVWSDSTNIIAGTTTTFAPLQDVDGSISVRVTLAGNGSNSPVLEDVAYATTDTSPTVLSSLAWIAPLAIVFGLLMLIAVWMLEAFGGTAGE